MTYKPYDPTKDTVLCDMDGTIALNAHRFHHIDKRPKDWDSWNDECHLDLPNLPVIRVIRGLFELDYKIVITSGRSDKQRAKTEAWLLEHDVPYNRMLMRPHGSRIEDTVLKRQWTESYKGEVPPIDIGRVFCVFDDRDRIVAMWRSLGLTCFQVAPGDF